MLIILLTFRTVQFILQCISSKQALNGLKETTARLLLWHTRWHYSATFHPMSQQCAHPYMSNLEKETPLGLFWSDIMLYQQVCLSVFPSDHRVAVDPFCSLVLLFMHSWLQIMHSESKSSSDDTTCLACLQWYLKQPVPCCQWTVKQKHTQEDKLWERGDYQQEVFNSVKCKLCVLVLALVTVGLESSKMAYLL